MKPTTITGQIEQLAFKLLEGSPDGIRWVDLAREIREKYPDFHPKTVNGTLWKLTEKYPDKVTKTTGLFRLINK